MQPKVGSLETLIRLENHLEILFLNEEPTVFTIRNKEEGTVTAVTQGEVENLSRGHQGQSSQGTQDVPAGGQCLWGFYNHPGPRPPCCGMRSPHSVAAAGERAKTKKKTTDSLTED